MMFKFTAILSVALAASLSFGQGEQPKAEPIAAPPGAAPIKPQQVRVRTRHPSDPVKVLFCTSSYGFKHDVLPLAREIMTKRGESLKWLEVTATESADAITGTNLLPALAEIDVLMLYTTGKLPFDARQLAAWVEAGGTLVGVHSATDTLSEDPDYVPLIGGVFDGHPWNEEVTLVAPDTNFAQPDLGFTAEYQTNPSRYTFRLSDEIYQFKQLSKDRTVTLRLAPGQPKMEEGRDYPIAWTSVRGKGRVFYTALGHGPNVWNNEEFVQHVLNGLWWAAENSGDRTCKACGVTMNRLPISYGLLAEMPDPDKVIAGGCMVGVAKHGFRCPKCKDTVVLAEE